MLPLNTREVGLEGRGMQLFIIAIIFASIALATVIVRFICRQHYARRFGIDDWIIASSMVVPLRPLYSIRPTEIHLFLGHPPLSFHMRQ